MSDRRRRAVGDLEGELEDTLAALRTAVDEGDAPVPPRSRDLLRLTDEYAIPTAIAVLEANVRALELLQGTIRMLDPERSTRTGVRTAREGASSLGRASLDRLDRALDDLDAALAEGGLPRDREARRLLTEARELNDELRDRVAAGDRSADRDAVRIDVESELETIKEQVGERDADGGSAGADGEE